MQKKNKITKGQFLLRSNNLQDGRQAKIFFLKKDVSTSNTKQKNVQKTNQPKAIAKIFFLKKDVSTSNTKQKNVQKTNQPKAILSSLMKVMRFCDVNGQHGFKNGASYE